MDIKTITLPKTRTLIFEYSLFLLAFGIPLFISGPQLLTGTLINTLLFLFALHAYSKNRLLIVILPSIGAVFNGLLFGTFTVFLLYFLPFIWISNYILIESFTRLIKKNSFGISVIVSSLMKVIFLFSVAYTFTTIKIVPPIFLQFMGLFQFYTAVLGGVGALLINTIIVKKND